MTLEPPKSSWYIIFQWNFLANTRSPSGPWCTTTSVLLTAEPRMFYPAQKWIAQYLSVADTWKRAAPISTCFCHPAGEATKSCAINWPLFTKFLRRFTAAALFGYSISRSNLLDPKFRLLTDVPKYHITLESHMPYRAYIFIDEPL